VNRLLYIAVFIGGFAALYGVGRAWKLKPETKYEHRLLIGEIAVATSQGGGNVWLALGKNDCSSINVAMSHRDLAYLKGCESNHTAFSIPSGTFVKVIGESVSRLRVQVIDGPFAGRDGSVDFQYLRPRQAGEFK